MDNKHVEQEVKMSVCLSNFLTPKEVRENLYLYSP